MRKILLICILAFFVFSVNVNAEISAQAAAVIDARNGYAVYEKNAYEKLSMASTTKIMTALLTLEAAGICDEVITVPYETAAVEGSSMGLREGYQLHLSDLAVGMLLPSGNDAATTAAVAIGGNLENFAGMMNTRAEEIGLENTNFVTPSGLDDDNHYSCAFDMALLGAEAMKNASFAEIAGSTQRQVNFVSPSFSAFYSNHNKLLTRLEGCIGIKTGFTKKSGRCLVSCAEKNGVRLVAVTLNAPDDWQDHEILYDACFSKFSDVVCGGFKIDLPLAGGYEDTISCMCSEVSLPLCEGEKIEYDIYKKPFYYAPVRAGETLGKVVMRLSDTVLYECDIKAPKTFEAYIKIPEEPDFFEKLGSFFGINKKEN